MTRPTVAVAIVTCDRRHVLAECLESVRVQVESPDELLVIDNGSSDGTAEFVRRHYPEARLIEFGHNLGCAPARNVAAKNLGSDWIFFFDDDSVLEPGAVAAVRAAALADPAVAVIAPQIVHVLPSGEERFAGGPARRVHTFTGQCALRREAMLEVGLYPSFKYGAEEQDLGFRLLDQGYAIRFDPAVVLRHSPFATVRDPNLDMCSKLVNHVVVRWKYLPLWLAFGATLRTVALNAYLSIRNGQVPGYLTALAALPRAIRDGLRERQPVRRETIRLYRELSRDHALPAALPPTREGRSS